MKIYTPVKGASGRWASVQFTNGVGECDDPKLIQWFKAHGYIVDNNWTAYDEPTITPKEIDNEEKVEVDMRLVNDPDFDAMTPLQLREWAKAHGLGAEIKNTRNKEKLLEIIRG